MKNIVMWFIFKRKIFSRLFFVCWIFLILTNYCFSEINNIPVSVSILAWQIDYWSPKYLNLWQINLSPLEQNIQWQFGDYFWVSDLVWSDNWYSTNIWCDDGLIWPNWTILTWVYLMAWNNGLPELLNWNPWNVQINQFFSGSFSSIFNWPVTYIYRNSWQNNWVVNKYGDRAWIRVVVPPYTQPWTYSWTIYLDI